MLVHPEHEEGQGGNQSGGCRDRESSEFAVGGDGIGCCEAVESSQSQGAADEVNGGDDPSEPRKFEENDFVDHQGWGDPEGYDVC